MNGEKPTPEGVAWVGGDTVDENNPLEGVNLESIVEKSEKSKNDEVPSIDSGSSPDTVDKGRLEDLANKIKSL